MNSVFERFTNIRRKWESSVWEPEFILFSLFKPFSTKAVPSSVCTLSSCCTRCWNISLFLPPSNTHSPCLSLASFLYRDWGTQRFLISLGLRASPPVSAWGEVLGYMSRSGIEHLYEMCFLGRLYFLLDMWCPQGRLHWVKPNVSLSSISLRSRTFSPLQGRVCELRKYTYI